MFSACGEGWNRNERSLVFSAIRVEVLAFTSWPFTDDIGNELFNNMCLLQLRQYWCDVVTCVSLLLYVCYL